MATSILDMASDPITNPSLLQLPDHQPIRRSSAGRRKPKSGGVCDSSSGQRKRQSRRGMGVEKLERLRLQERWRKMTEIDASTGAPFTVPAVPGSFADRTDLINASASFQFSKRGGFGFPNLSLGQMGLTQFGPGFQGEMGSIGGLVSDQFQISKELSSNPNPVIFPSNEHCYSCQKKKRLVLNGENLDCSEAMRSVQISSGPHHSGFLGLNARENLNLKNKDYNQGLGAKLALFSPVGYAAVRTGYPDVEVVAVHRKEKFGNTDPEEGGQVMEYEFFPSTVGRKDSDENCDELLMMKVSKKASSSVHNCVGSGHIQQTLFSGFESFDIAAAPTSCSSSIDLSLKLSY